MGMEKARLMIEDGGSIPVQFNPAEYNLSSSVNYAEKSIPGFPGPITEYISGNADTLNLNLTLDTYDTKPDGSREVKVDGTLADLDAPPEPTDVTKLTREIAKLLTADGSLHRPPIVTFKWGPLQFKGVLTELKQNFTMFMPDGMPVRARLELSLKSVIDVKNKKREEPFESPDRTKFRTVHEGENLWNFAAAEYDDPEKWRVIAKENGLMDPLELRPGQVLKLPAL